jgi:hypothetical protein
MKRIPIPAVTALVLVVLAAQHSQGDGREHVIDTAPIRTVDCLGVPYGE